MRFFIAIFVFGMCTTTWAIDFKHDEVVDNVRSEPAMDGESVDIRAVIQNGVLPPLTAEERRLIEARPKKPNPAQINLPGAVAQPGVNPGKRTANAPLKKGAHGGLLLDGRVARAVFTTEILNREPYDVVKEISVSREKVYFFSDLRKLRGKEAIHRWTYNDKVVLEKKFKVGGPRWRVWSQIDASKFQPGKWTVSVFTGDGELLAQNKLKIMEVTATSQE